ncbi:MAG TPA: alanine racemase [bacterium]|nr:alanine racemase [bacterium]
MKDGVRVTRVEINLDNLRHNLGEARKRVGNTKIMAVVKGNAYGHGMTGISRFLERERVDYFGIALLEEGIELRKAGIKTPILVLGCIQPEEAEEAVKYALTLNLCSMEIAKELSVASQKLNKKAAVHIKVDTGQVRYGLLPEDTPAFVDKISRLKGLFMEGIFSYGASEEKLEIFMKLLDTLKNKGYTFPLKHIASSSSVFNRFSESYLDMVRIGLFLHGSGRDARSQETKPVFSMKTAVAFVKTIPAGKFSFYGLGYELKEATDIAVIAMGYGDGYPKKLSRKGEVLIRGKRFPIAGIGMDTLRVDAGNEGIKAGEEVQVIGKQGNEEITVYEIVQKLGIGVNELTGVIATRVPRVFIENGKRIIL